MSGNQFVRVRNDNNSITYVGDWTILQADTVDNLINLVNGPPFSPTLHSTTTTSSFSFPFRGSSIGVVSSINIANLSESNQDPSWTCAVDGSTLGLLNLSAINQQNGEVVCSIGGLTDDAAHELVVNVTSRGMPFYLDYIEYIPSSDIPLENSFVVVSVTDPGVDFISGWENIGIRVGTTDPDGLVNVTFTGMQLMWFAYIPISEPHTTPSSGIFSVDSQPYTPFQIPGLEQQFSAPAYNQLLFTTPMLEMGKHMVSAKYTGSAGESPFTFEYLIVTNGSFPSTNTTTITPSSSSTNTTPTTSSSTNPIGRKGGNPTSPPAPFTNDVKNSSHANVGSMVGGVVGGVGGILICTVILFFWLRSRRKNLENRGVIESFTVQPQFVSPGTPLLGSNQTAGNQRMLSIDDNHHHRKPSMSTLPNPPLSSSNSVPPYTANLGTSRPLPAPPPVTQLISPSLRNVPVQIGATPNTIAPIRHDDSGIRLSPILAESLMELPPLYSCT